MATLYEAKFAGRRGRAPLPPLLAACLPDRAAVTFAETAAGQETKGANDGAQHG